MARTFLILALLTASTAVVAQPEPPAPVVALIIVDIQEFYFPGGAMPLVDPEPASANAGELLVRFRERGDLVVHVQHESDQGMANHADVAPVTSKNEVVVVKQQVNAFQDTDLLEILQSRDVNQLVIVGMQTHMCLEGAVRAAVDYGFATTVVSDACATRDLKYGDAMVAAADVHASTLATLRAYAEVVDAETYLSR